ncbi:hypothetical protein KO481_27330 [Nocardia sp. NEAU-G5]|uniref:Uncharacterized protein n=1 Tax=Nocardia albiluteola TaxID=2842303 RepID=A0ABS6B4J7_9NOCA|nr:hypothetical protein [Nocardia albiluteola]MBU3065227.1 hypothetical protein [Nocardia albiluteola]
MIKRERIRMVSTLAGWLGAMIWDYVVWYRVWPFWLFGVGLLFLVLGYSIGPASRSPRLRRWLRPRRTALEDVERARAELLAAQRRRRRNAGRGRRKRRGGS